MAILDYVFSSPFFHSSNSYRVEVIWL